MVNEHFTIKFKHIYLSNTQIMKNIFNQYFPINTHINPTFYNQCQSISQLCTIPILNHKIHSFQHIIVISKYISTSLNEVHKHFVHFEMTVSTFQFISTFPISKTQNISSIHNYHSFHHQSCKYRSISINMTHIA